MEFVLAKFMLIDTMCYVILSNIIAEKIVLKKKFYLLQARSLKNSIFQILTSKLSVSKHFHHFNNVRAFQ